MEQLLWFKNEPCSNYPSGALTTKLFQKCQPYTGIEHSYGFTVVDPSLLLEKYTLSHSIYGLPVHLSLVLCNH